MIQALQTLLDAWNPSDAFSGVVSVRDAEGPLLERAFGWRQRAERLPNETDTAFAIASGTKLFTALAACTLIDAGKLSLDSRVWDVVRLPLGTIDKSVTVRHLLTHTSGIGDYIDEEAGDSFEGMLAMYAKTPVYTLDTLASYLPLFNALPPKFAPGERFGYSNAGFVLLGLVIESACGMPYQQYVTRQIIQPLGLAHTGFYRMDRLPGNTALGYTQDEGTGLWHTNIFCVPALGGADGGLFTCAADMDTLWRALLAGNILSESMRAQCLSPQVPRQGDTPRFYGLGVYLLDPAEKPAYYAVGGDFGVDFVSGYLPRPGLTVSVLGNTEMNTWPMFQEIYKAFA